MELSDEIQALAVKIAVLETSLHEQKQALILQAREYERRLDELNHAYRQQQERNVLYLSRESYEQRHELLQNQLIDIQVWRSKIAGIHTGIGIAGGIVGGVIGTIVAKIFR